jgi:Domain of unknown function (DUF3854)
MANFNPPIILQSTETEFQSAIRDEFITKSAISPELFEAIAEFVSDQDIQNGEVVGNPIAEFLNWEVKTSQAGFGPTKENTYGLLLRNEDGTPWQAKLNYQSWNPKKSRYDKPYQAPKRSDGELSPAYLPPIGPVTRQAIGTRYGVEFPSEGSFWDFVEAHPEIDIVITEGGKKSLCSLSYGVVTIALYGCDAGSKKIDGEHVLIPDLARFCQPGRTFILAFDKDQNPKTIERVRAAESRLAWLLRKQAKGITVKVANWETSQGKGLDDLVVNCGPEALHEAILESTVPPREELWMCLDSHNHQLGTWVQPKDEDKEPYFSPQTNFDFTVSKILEDKTGGGIELEVTWLDRSIVRTRRALVKTAETFTEKDFRGALTRGLGTHFTSILKPNDLAALIQNRKTQYSRSGGVVYRLADRTGQQDDGTWVFENVQFKADGTPTNEQESRWMFNHALGELENIPSPIIAPQNPEAIKDLVKALQAFYSPEAMPYVLLTMGFAVMGLHRQEIMKSAGSVASLAIYGAKGGGKSTAQLAAASLYGLQDFKLSTVSESAFFEIAKSLGNLPIQWDDPIRQGKYAVADEEKVNSALWKLFTALSRVVRGNSQAPNTIVSISSNRTLGNNNAAIASRLISFIFPVRSVNRAAGEALTQAMKAASGGFSQLLAIPYDHQTIVTQGNQLLEHLSESDARNAQSLATLAHFTQKFCELAGVDFDALTFIKKYICPQTNEQGAGKDSLTPLGIGT